MVEHRRDRVRAPARRGPKRDAKARLLVFCEGRVTEPEYLRAFCKEAGGTSASVKVATLRGVPLTLVQEARKHQSGDWDAVWCVLDHDDHPRLPEAIDLAAGNGIQVAFSNPCFELWLLLHFRESPGAQQRRTVGQLLRERLPGYEKHVAYEHFAPTVGDARRRARQLDKHARDAGELRRNPTTGVYRLLDAIESTSSPG